MIVPRSPLRLSLLLIGTVMVLFAIAVANDAYARFLTGGVEKDLEWGPALFRVLLVLHGGLLIVLSFTRNVSGSVGEAPASETNRPGRRTPRSAILALIVLSIIAFVLRLWNLNSDLWIDEVLTVLDFVRKPLGEIVTSFSSQNQHMLFSILARVSTGVFGESSWSVRVPSVIFAIASIWALFFLCKRLVGTREALLGSVLMTVSYHHIWFSQNARGYMGLLLFTLLATWCWFEALESNKWNWWLCYAASIVLGMWVHPTMAFVMGAHGIVHVLFLIWPRLSGAASPASPERRSAWRPFASWLLSVTVTLQLYALALPEFLAVGLHEESKDSEWTNPLWVVTESLQSLKIGFAGTLFLFLGAAFVTFGWARLFKLNRRAAVLLVLPAILAGGTMVLLGHNIWPRFFFFSMGFGLLIVIHGASEVPRMLRRYIAPVQTRPSLASFAGVFLCSLLIAASVTTLPKNYSLPKQNFSQAKVYVEEQILAGDGIVAVSLAGIVYGSYLEPHWPVAKTAPELAAIEQQSERIWLVYTIPIEVQAFRPDIWKMIENNYEVVKVFPGTLNGGEVFVCKRKLHKRG